MKHRNPLLEPSSGIGLQTFAVDILHTLNLGIYAKFLGKAWWALISADAFRVQAGMGGRRNVEELALNSIGPLKTALNSYYKAFEAANPGVKLNKIQDVSVKTLGSQNACALNCKAAEMRPLLRFTATLLAEKRGFLLPAEEALVPAADALASFSEALRTLPRGPVPVHVSQPVMNLLKRYTILAKEAGVPEIPKLHLAFHLVHRIGLQGSPALAATFLDEGANGVAAEMARGLHRSTWTRRFFAFWLRLADSGSKRKLD